MDAATQGDKAWEWDPFLVPNWRFEDAQRLAKGEDPTWSRDDPVVVQCLAYLNALANAHDDQERAAAEHRWPSLAAAHKIVQDNGPQRWEIEARLLVGQSDAEVAAKCNILPDVVSQYEPAFFSIRKCLEAWAYLLNQVVGDGVYRGFQDQEVKNFWAWVALDKKLPVLEAMIETFHRVRRPGEPLAMRVYLEAERDIDPRTQALVAGAVLPPFGPMGERWGMLQLRRLEAQAAHDPDRGATMRDRVRDDLIVCARDYLAGKPLPSTTRLGRKPSKMQSEPAQDLRDGIGPDPEPRSVLGDPCDAPAERSQDGQVSGADGESVAQQ